MKIGLACLALGGSLSALPVPQVNASNQPEELGQVSWERDHEQAFLKARQSDKPVLLLFQEIPG